MKIQVELEIDDKKTLNTTAIQSALSRAGIYCTVRPLPAQESGHVCKHTLTVMKEVEDAHFRTTQDTGASSQALLVWNALRRRLGLPWLDIKDLPEWDVEK